jgi:hypothetical protein
MIPEELPPTEAELREAEELARALEQEQPGPPGEALQGALLLLASRRGQLGELRGRAVLERAWQGSDRARPRRARLSVALAGLAACVAAIFVVTRAQGPAMLPSAPPSLLRAQLAAARPGAAAAELIALESEMAAHRARLHAAVARAYGSGR